MQSTRVFITGLGIISPAGQGVPANLIAFRNGERHLRPLTLFSVPNDKRFPVGEVISPLSYPDIPRTHRLALMAAEEAMAGRTEKPDAVIVGGTTGGILTTEELLLNQETDPKKYCSHGINTVAENIASHFGCEGPVIGLSTACSSGAVALKLAFDLIRSGSAKSVLAGGADSLCRMTYFGFSLLQLVDPEGARPLDKNRRGMTVGEGAAILLLEAAEKAPETAVAELLGGGLSCDAHHLTTPHPDGEGALKAMQLSLSQAGLKPEKIDYINLHGTGTRDNDEAEAKALNALFGPEMPPLSSIKGIIGHSLGASGAIEAVASSMVVSQRFWPVNVGCLELDENFGLASVVTAPQKPSNPIRYVLSNSFGFGGNNAALVFGKADQPLPEKYLSQTNTAVNKCFKILACDCISGVGRIMETLNAFREQKSCKGCLSQEKLAKGLPPRQLRRLKRLSQMTLGLADSVVKQNSDNPKPKAVVFGTGMGCLSETNDFLHQLFDTDFKFSSPTDFMASVDNAPSGRIATHLKATGSNIVISGSEAVFEQALWATQFLADDPILLIAADESHPRLSPLCDQSPEKTKHFSDGGAAFLMTRNKCHKGVKLNTLFLEYSQDDEKTIQHLIDSLGGVEKTLKDYTQLWVNLPADNMGICEKRLHLFTRIVNFNHTWFIRNAFGAYPAVSATAAALASRLALEGERILIVGLGIHVSAVEILL